MGQSASKMKDTANNIHKSVSNAANNISKPEDIGGLFQAGLAVIENAVTPYSCESDPACLEQKYNSASGSAENAPFQVGLAAYNWQSLLGEKNLVGDASYNAFLQKNVDAHSQALLEKVTTQFQTEANEIRGRIDNYNTTFLQSRHLIDAYYEYLTKNKNLDSDITNVEQQVMKNGRKTYYEQHETTQLQRYETYILWTYKFLVFICLLGFFIADTDLTPFEKIGFFFAFFLYPYFVELLLIPIVFWFFRVCHSIYQFFVLKDVYSSEFYRH
jgi:hypothetical protein